VAASGDGDAQPLLIDQGTVDSLTWAPDGKRLAFVSHRGGHSLIGVYDFVDQTIVWLSPSLDYDSSPAFSPDGARIAFVHVRPRKLPPLLLPTQRTAVVDLDGGRENRPGATCLDCRRGTRKCIPSDARRRRRSRRSLGDEPVLDQP
jgi:Periplasmic component of the Tol biopolymer transport system